LTGPGGVLVGTDDRGVDRDDPLQVAFGIGLASRAVNTFSQVPSAAHFRRRLWAPFHDPKWPGRSIHGAPVRYLNAIASITCR
jgi:hypothetical protein